MQEGESKVCADCGADIIEFPAGSNRWARVAARDDEWTSGRTYEFCCRVLYDTSGDPPFPVLRADYHHPRGAPQRHFSPPKAGLA